MSQRFRHSIRFKLMLAALSLLIIPWAGYQYLLETEDFLRSAHDRNMANTARALALLVQSNRELIPHLTPATEKYPSPNLYVHSMAVAPDLDGFSDDWAVIDEQYQVYTQDNDLHLQVLVAEHEGYLYLMLKVRDDQFRYQTGSLSDAQSASSVRLLFTTPNHIVEDFLFIPVAQGMLKARRRNVINGKVKSGPMDYRITGNWQDVSGGYNLELRINKHIVGKQLALQINKGNTSVPTALATSDVTTPKQLGKLVYPVPELSSLLQQASQVTERRRVLSLQAYVLGEDGTLDSTSDQGNHLPWFVNKLTSLILRQQTDSKNIFVDSQQVFDGQSSQINTAPITAALRGTPSMIRYQSPLKDHLILAASHPVLAYGQPIGAVLVEQSTQALLSLQNHALQRLLAITFILFLVVALTLLGFASLLTVRIRRLHRQVDAAVTPDGRIISTIEPVKSTDEIGDLSRGFSSVLARLSAYNHYLEAMASRLTHELRTPLAIVRTSLESCTQITSEQALSPYLLRAQEGTERLETIIKRLREAASLEKSFADATLESINLCDLLKRNIETFADIYPGVLFSKPVCQTAVMINGAPDLISQAMEKIIANAVEFHQQGTAIETQLIMDDKQATICVSNIGRGLPEDIDLFQSMVSVREKSTAEPHLGLGLYLVKLIAEFHQGAIEARNLESGKGVKICFSVASNLRATPHHPA